MIPNKLKAWRVVVDKRLAAIENLIRDGRNIAKDIEHRSPIEGPTEPEDKQSANSWIRILGKRLSKLLGWFVLFLSILTGYFSIGVQKSRFLRLGPLIRMIFLLLVS
jgi:hypothetical protein